MSLNLIDDKSTLSQVMVWCSRATSHYLSQCWPRPITQAITWIYVDQVKPCQMPSLSLNELNCCSRGQASALLTVLMLDLSKFVSFLYRFVSRLAYFPDENLLISGSGVSGWKFYDDLIKWKRFPCYWPFVRGIHRSPVNSPHKGQWHGPLIFSLICAWINYWVNNREAGDLRHHRAHYDVNVMPFSMTMSSHEHAFHITSLLSEGKPLVTGGLP